MINDVFKYKNFREDKLITMANLQKVCALNFPIILGYRQIYFSNRRRGL